MKRAGTILLLVIAAAGFWLSGRLNEPLLNMRREYRIDQGEPLENTPPIVAFTTVALGGFRGIIADILWLRASRLQDAGKYFELVQLADWITKLEPRFAEVWAYHSWNLAYNISVMFADPEDRWRWVRSGIGLLRDEGLYYNPGAAQLYRELGWMFQHKLGATYDQAHNYYKRAWAAEMGELFDGPTPDYAALIGAPEGSPAWARAERARRIYKLDPALMQTVDEEYGPLDWRLPWAHAIYWAWRGKQHAEGFESIAASRMIFQCMATSFRLGSLFVDPGEDVFFPSPDLDILPRVIKAFKEALAEFPDDETIRIAYPNFLAEAIVILYSYNRMDQARALFDEMRDEFPSELTQDGFDEFVYRAFTAQVEDLDERDIAALITGAAYQAYFWAMLGDNDRATGFDKLASSSWQRYMDARTNPEYRERTGLPPLEEIRKRAQEEVRKNLRRDNTRDRVPDGD